MNENRLIYPTEKVERNAEIWQRHEEGVGITKLGRLYDISPARVKQILTQEERKHRA